MCGFVDGCLASVRVEQCIELDGLPLDGTYSVRTVTTASPDAHENASAADGHATQALIITVEGEVECNHGASVPGLKGVIEGILYYQVRLTCSKSSRSFSSSCIFYCRVRALWGVSADLRMPLSQSREASVLFLDMLTLSGAALTTPEDAHDLRWTQHHTAEAATDGGEFVHDNAATSDDGDDTSRASSDLSWCVQSCLYRNKSICGYQFKWHAFATTGIVQGVG